MVKAVESMTTADKVIAEARADACKEKVEAAKKQLIQKYKELNKAKEIVNNIMREIEDLELSIRQEFAE